MAARNGKTGKYTTKTPKEFTMRVTKEEKEMILELRREKVEKEFKKSHANCIKAFEGAVKEKKEQFVVCERCWYTYGENIHETARVKGINTVKIIDRGVNRNKLSLFPNHKEYYLTIEYLHFTYIKFIDGDYRVYCKKCKTFRDIDSTTPPKDESDDEDKQLEDWFHNRK